MSLDQQSTVVSQKIKRLLELTNQNHTTPVSQPHQREWSEQSKQQKCEGNDLQHIGRQVALLREVHSLRVELNQVKEQNRRLKERVKWQNQRAQSQLFVECEGGNSWQNASKRSQFQLSNEYVWQHSVRRRL